MGGYGVDYCKWKRERVEDWVGGEWLMMMVAGWRNASDVGDGGAASDGCEVCDWDWDGDRDEYGADVPG